MTMAPLVVKGKVLVGNSGGEMGVRGWLTALDAESGKIVWRAYSTGPDKDVLIGPDFKAPYDWMKGNDLGVKTWPTDHWQHGGGTVWGWISYDPELNLIYYGTSNPGPWNSNQRPGDNLWTATIFARDPDTGQAKWAYQTSPHDLWDHDSINEVVLLDLKIDGKMRKVLVRPGRTGYMYVIDRTNGKLVSAKAYDKVTAYLGVDMQTGRIKPNPEKEPRLGRTVEDVCPASPGTKDWQPTAWSPRTKLLYVPHQHICMNFADRRGRLHRRHALCRRHRRHVRDAPATTIAASSWPGTRSRRSRPGRSRNASRSTAARWSPPATSPSTEPWIAGSRRSTPGPASCCGSSGRRPASSASRSPTWAAMAVSTSPSCPVSADGRVRLPIAGLDPRARNGALGFIGAMQDLPAFTQGGSTLLVFALPKQAVAAAGGNAAAAPAQPAASKPAEPAAPNTAPAPSQPDATPTEPHPAAGTTSPPSGEAPPTTGQ